MNVWKNIEEELRQRRLNAAWLGRKLGASRQVISGWKRRGVPTARYEEIAALFEWSLDRLVNAHDMQNAPGPPEAPPEKPVLKEAVYSPMAMDIARRLDEIQDDQQRSRAYALFVQIASLIAAPAIPPDRAPTAPDVQPNSSHWRAM